MVRCIDDEIHICINRHERENNYNGKSSFPDRIEEFTNKVTKIAHELNDDMKEDDYYTSHFNFEVLNDFRGSIKDRIIYKYYGEYLVQKQLDAESWLRYK